MKILAWLWPIILFVLALEEFFIADVLYGFELNQSYWRFVLPAVLISAALISFPLVFRLIKPKAPSKAHAFIFHVAVIAGLIFLLKAGAHYFERKITIEFFQRPVGNCNPHLGFLMRSPLGERAIRKIMAQLHPYYQYAYFAGEDYCRARKVGGTFKFPRPEICQQLSIPNDPIECFKELLTRTGPHSSIGALTHSQTAARILGLTDGPRKGMLENAKATVKMGSFVLHMRKLREQAGSPEEILEQIPQADKDKFQSFTQKYLLKITQLLTKPVNEPGSED